MAGSTVFRFKRQNSIQTLLNIFSVGIAGVMLVHFQNPRSDFQLFYNAAAELLHGSSPWLVATHSPDQGYLNGAATLTVITFFTLFKFEHALLILRILMISSILMFIYKSGKEESPRIKIVFIFLTLTSIPLRANLEYGALGLLMFIIWYFAVNNSNKYSQSILGAILALTLDFKPQIFWINLIILLGISRLGKYVFFSTLLVPWLIQSLILQRFLIIDWIEVVIRRSKLAQTENSQMDLACILRMIGLNSTLSLFVLISSIIVFTIFVVKLKKFDYVLKNPVILMAISVAFNVFLHPTDLTVFLPLLLILIREISLSGNVRIGILTLPIGLLSIWSNDLKFAIASSSLSFLVILLLDFEKNFKTLTILFFNFSIPTFFVLLTKENEILENFLRNSMNYLGFLLTLLVILFWQNPDIKKRS